MKTLRQVLLILLIVSLLMSGCTAGQTAEGVTAPTEATQASTEAPTEAPTEVPTEPTEPEGYQLAETVFPETDAATGTLKFYIKGQEIYAGGPVSSILDAGVTSYDDFEQIIQPWHMSNVIRVRVELEDTKDKDKPYVFFVAMNASNEPKKLSECLFYSITINGDSGVQFGSGNETEPFVTGVSTKEDLFAAYGEPDYSKSEFSAYLEVAYYEPFSCAYFAFQNGKVRQIFTYYSANLFGDLTENFEYEFTGSYFGNDCYILMNQYLDVTPYLPDVETEVQSGIVEKLSEKITFGETEIEFGGYSTQMPDPFGAAFVDILMPVYHHYYVQTGRVNAEEFYLINQDGGSNTMAADLRVKGAVTENRYYVNWGNDSSAYNEFQYENLTQNSTIDNILEQYGAPMEMNCTSYARACFAWLHYKDQGGNTLQICVDPILNQLVEIRVAKYFEGELVYK
ncbi:MAG: hypothetical protein IJ512_08700 [Ruminococcus sp.]|nr:hypothetical protein [Ruminococcus sp.]